MDFFGLFGSKKKSGEIAKNRLQLVLIQDRMNTSPEMLQNLKTDLIRVLEKYVDIDHNALDIRVGGSDRGNDEGPALLANIPIVKWKKQ